MDGKEEILAAIRRAAEALGRTPSRGELRRLTGVSHYRVLAEFRTLREAIRAAGLEPNPKGEKISTEDLLEDWRRVERKLGRRPSRAEYVREGRYSAGAFAARFGAWGKIEEKAFTTKDTKNKDTKNAERSGQRSAGEPGHRKAKAGREMARTNEDGGEKALAFEFGMQLAQLPEPLVGKRKITELVVAMVVNTLLPTPARANAALARDPVGDSDWQMATGQNENPFTTEDTEGHKGKEIEKRGDWLTPRGIHGKNDLGPALPVKAPLVQDDGMRRADFTARGIDKGRAVLGEPFDRSPMTNAPVNELGVVLLFGMVAAEMGFQVEALWGRFPDCEAKRRVAKGKWQRSRIEFEYESKNFALHGHDPKGCDVIVCWRHNWKAAPENLEIIALEEILRRGWLLER